MFGIAPAVCGDSVTHAPSYCSPMHATDTPHKHCYTLPFVLINAMFASDMTAVRDNLLLLRYHLSRQLALIVIYIIYIYIYSSNPHPIWVKPGKIYRET